MSNLTTGAVRRRSRPHDQRTLRDRGNSVPARPIRCHRGLGIRLAEPARRRHRDRQRRQTTHRPSHRQPTRAGHHRKPEPSRRAPAHHRTPRRPRQRAGQAHLHRPHAAQTEPPRHLDLGTGRCGRPPRHGDPDRRPHRRSRPKPATRITTKGAGTTTMVPARPSPRRQRESWSPRIAVGRQRGRGGVSTSLRRGLPRRCHTAARHARSYVRRHLGATPTPLPAP